MNEIALWGFGSLLSTVAMGLNIPLQGSLFGLPMAMRQANHCCNYLRVHLTICMQFAWFGCGERSTNLPWLIHTPVSALYCKAASGETQNLIMILCMKACSRRLLRSWERESGTRCNAPIMPLETVAWYGLIPCVLLRRARDRLLDSCESTPCMLGLRLV